jgi:hypothetical protein
LNSGACPHTNVYFETLIFEVLTLILRIVDERNCGYKSNLKSLACGFPVAEKLFKVGLDSVKVGECRPFTSDLGSDGISIKN